jgi:indole-3-glycerol phosphate synthase
MILDALLDSTRVELARRQALVPDAALRERLAGLPEPLDLCAALRQPGVSIIAEVKRASPSRGALNLDLQPAALAESYARAGAAAISVLTEPSRFRGSLDDLRAVRDGLAKAGLARPLLRKDFIVDSYQLVEARLYGADAALLIAAALDDRALGQLYDEALALNLTPLIEVHDEGELRRALALRPALVGINNRDLRDFRVDLDVTRRLRPLIPSPTCVVSESGIRAPEPMRLLAELGVDAALVGEALVTSADPGATLRLLREAGQ